MHTLILLAFILTTLGKPAFSEGADSVSRTEALIQQLGTGDIRQEDSAKHELIAHPSPEALAVLLRVLPFASATVQNNIIDVLDVYHSPDKIPALIQRQRGMLPWNSDPRIDSQLYVLGASAVDPLMRSVSKECEGEADTQYAEWVGSLLGEIKPDGVRALLVGLTTANQCNLTAAERGLILLHANIAGDPSDEDDAEEGGSRLLVEAAENSDPKVRETAVDWITHLKEQNWPNFNYSQFTEALIETYRSNESGSTREEIARMLATAPCRRVSRFMRAAVHAPDAQVRAIAKQYLAPTPASIEQKPPQ